MSSPLPDLRAVAQELVATGLDGMGERLVRVAFAVGGSDSLRNEVRNFAGTVSTVSDAVTQVYSALPSGAVGMARALLVEVSLERILSTLGLKDAAIRANLIVAYLGGVVATRYVLGMQPLAGMSDDEAVAVVAPTIQRLLDPRIRVQDL